TDDNFVDAITGLSYDTGYFLDSQGRLAKITAPSGLQTLTEYYAATDTGEPAGYVKDTVLVNPKNQARWVQSYTRYQTQASGSDKVYVVSDVTVYAGQVTDPTAQGATG